ncbi:MAG: CRISPR-associated endonuclease Cas2 [Sulfurimonas sp.]|nr:MAG: CRISPR-associated endonuclease Cas2 [Sulfurimonas sp.]
MTNKKDAISGYRKMVLFVMFDMPTETKNDLKKYRNFRKKLFELGFILFQYSIYIRFCRSLAISEKYERKVEQFAPLNGSIRVLRITEEQYKQMKIIENYREKPEKKVYEQTQTVMVF